MTGLNMMSSAYLGKWMCELLIACTLLFCGSPASASTLQEDLWQNHSCNGCHGTPPQMVHDGRAFDATMLLPSVLQGFADGTDTNPTMHQLCNQSDIGLRFSCWFPGTPLTRATNAGQGGTMAAFVTWISTHPDDATLMGQYLLDSYQGSVTPARLDFGLVPINTTQTNTISITNVRFADFAYLGLTSPGGDFSLPLHAESCVNRTVAGIGTASTNTCTITVAYTPSAAASSATKTLQIDFATPASGDPTPKSMAIQLGGRGTSVPTATIAAITSPLAEGTAVPLDANATWPNGTTGSYTWTVVDHFGTQVLPSPAGAHTSFVASVRGFYTVTLTVDDGIAHSTTGPVTVEAIQQPAAAIALRPLAGPYYIANTITFDGIGSTKQTGHNLSYAWSITPTPSGSAFQVGSTPSTATFTPSDGQAYVVSLDVDDQGVHTAVAATSTVTAVAPPPPHADAGMSRPVLVNIAVQLDGTHSRSSNGHAVTCAWAVMRHSDGAAQTVTNANSCSASFTPTVIGDFDVTLTVNDGYSSATASITITSSDGTVSVNAGSDQSVILGVTAALSGSATSGIGDPLNYAWTLTSAPSGSLAVIATPGSATAASLTPDVQGTYVARLTATDQHGHGNFASTTIMVKPPLTSAPSLSFAASLGSSATASATVQNNASSPVTLQSISFGGATPGDYAVDAANGCSVGTPIAQATFCTLVIRFTPTVVGARNAAVSLAYAHSGSPLDITLLGSATPMPQGVLSSTSWSQAFDDTVIGASSIKSVTVSNTSVGPSAAPIVFSSFTLAGAASADYQLGGTCSTSTPLAPQATCSLVITFAPSATGARAASLQIASNASNPLVSIGLAGNGLPAPAPVLSIAPAPLNFGQQTVGGSYPPQVATLTNTGTAPLSISTITIAGTGFTIADTSACAGATLANNASCQVSVNFAPPSVQAGFVGTLTIASNVPGSPAALGLVGTGTAAAAPVLAWSPAASTLDFGTVQAGAISATQSVTLANQGPGGASLSFVNAVGQGSSAFSISRGTCSTTQPLFAGASCRLDIVFAPSVAGARSATLQVVSNGSAPAPVALTGTGLGGPALALALSTNAMDFGTVQLGTRSLPSALRLSNSGSGTLQIASIGATGAFSVQGSSCPPAPFTLQSGAECTVTVMFQPTSTGATTGMLSVQSDAQAQSGDVALAGKGEDAPDLSSGGCSVSRGGNRFDPTLWCLGALAILALAYRKRQRRRDSRRDRENAQ